ncbi:MAG: hypothetical protein [Caudoviricetes sp.]|nr:MAG: hypothetical protein [Caudoviricetes sp.]
MWHYRSPRAVYLCNLIHRGQNSAPCQNFVNEHPALLRPFGVKNSIRAAVAAGDADGLGFCITLPHVFLIEDPLTVDLVLDPLIMEYLVELSGRHIIVGSNLRGGHRPRAGKNRVHILLDGLEVGNGLPLGLVLGNQGKPLLLGIG